MVSLAGAGPTICLGPIPFADDGGTPASPPAPRFPIWRFLLALTALTVPAEVRGSGVLAGLDVLRGRYGTTGGAVIALTGIAAVVALIRRNTGMTLGAAL